MMLKTQITADRTAASAASTTASPLAHRVHGPGTEIALTLLVHRVYRVWCSFVLKAPFLSSSPRYEISPNPVCCHYRASSLTHPPRSQGPSPPEGEGNQLLIPCGSCVKLEINSSEKIVGFERVACQNKSVRQGGSLLDGHPPLSSTPGSRFVCGEDPPLLQPRRSPEVLKNMDPLRNGNNCEEDSQCAEEEEVDPRIQGELEKLNQSTDDINRWESELEDCRQRFRAVLVEATVKLDEQVKRIGRAWTPSRANR
ncbi:SH3 domain-binding protein 5-like protein [Lates japonicus]|uniref:SH3 domain-binding protein 5 n=1 Tax=Lates japonicus TaxID=270547 RepID=A0AAD3R7G3_LATJO|nr:SH3 domain-binding protein 5-like protein [Lates japonicus]